MKRLLILKVLYAGGKYCLIILAKNMTLKIVEGSAIIVKIQKNFIEAKTEALHCTESNQGFE